MFLDRQINKLLTRWIPVRILICLMMFTACWTSYACRLQMPILVVPMIKEEPTNITNTLCLFDESRQRRDINPFDPGSYLEAYILDKMQENQEEAHSLYRREVSTSLPQAKFALFSDEPFEWTPTMRGQLLAGYGYGNVPGNLLGGWMAMKYGARKSILWSSVVAAVISLISPFLAHLHWVVLLVSRIIIGITGGMVFPACHAMVARWAPPNERSRFVWSLLGGTFGTIITYPMVAAIADHINWESGWYIPSLLMFLWICFWALIAYDSPLEHPAISDKEKDYIISTQAGIVRIEKPTWEQTPIFKIMTSIPFLSLIVCHFGNLFLLFFYQNALMLYLTKTLGFELTKGGALAAAPWACRLICGFGFSWGGDTIKKKKIISITLLRKIATVFSHLIPGIFLILVGYVGCNFTLANVYLSLALGFNGAALISNLSNNQDLAPNFAGFLYGIMNTVGTTCGFIIPPMVEGIAGKYGNSVERWQILFWIAAGLSIGTMVIYWIGGSGEVQEWNEFRTEPEQRERSKSGVNV